MDLKLWSRAAFSIVVAAACVGYTASSADAATARTTPTANQWCHPHDNTARVLSKPAPNAIHKDWMGENYIGTSWSLKPKQMIRSGSFAFVNGDLYSPRGGLINKNVYVLASEWSCD